MLNCFVFTVVSKAVFKFYLFFIYESFFPPSLDFTLPTPPPAQLSYTDFGEDLENFMKVLYRKKNTVSNLTSQE